MKKLLIILIFSLFLFGLVSAGISDHKKCATECSREILNNTFVVSGNETTGDALSIMQMLKDMNLGLADELDACQVKLDKKKFNENVMYFSLAITFFLVVSRTFDIIRERRKKNEIN